MFRCCFSPFLLLVFSLPDAFYALDPEEGAFFLLFVLNIILLCELKIKNSLPGPDEHTDGGCLH